MNLFLQQSFVTGFVLLMFFSYENYLRVLFYFDPCTFGSKNCFRNESKLAEFETGSSLPETIRNR